MRAPRLSGPGIGRVSASAQRIYPIPGIPRTRDGQPSPHGTRSPGRRRQARSLRPVAAPANSRPRRPGLEMGPNLEDFMRPGDPAPAPSGRGALPATAGAISWRTGPQDVACRMASRTGCSSVRRSRSRRTRG
jgi:hypothetical protein